MFKEKVNLVDLSVYTQIELYVLEDWDGADGRYNNPNGFITDSKSFADEWQKSKVGASYTTVKGILVRNQQELENGADEIEKQKAMEKLTDREKELLGLTQKPKPTTVYRPRGIQKDA